MYAQLDRYYPRRPSSAKNSGELGRGKQKSLEETRRCFARGRRVDEICLEKIEEYIDHRTSDERTNGNDWQYRECVIRSFFPDTI